MTVCNSCRYCEGLCAVFPAMELRRVFARGDLNFIANLCHSCAACYDACQFAPPHEFAVNVPLALAKLRPESWQTYAWPRSFAGLFMRNGTKVALVTAFSMAVLLAGVTAFPGPGGLFAVHTGPGAFYRIIPHQVMVLLFGGVFSFALLALAMSVRAFLADLPPLAPLRGDRRSIRQAVKDAASLRYLEGGGVGCVNEDEQPGDRRRLFHHLTSYGFLLCFAATSTATSYHYLIGREAPYVWYDLPVVLGSLGGMGLIAGPIGLLAARWRRRAELGDPGQAGQDDAFSILLLLTSVSGFALLLLRATPLMGVTLALHLGFVLAFFITLPYSRFVHAGYRFAALLRHARETSQPATRA